MAPRQRAATLDMCAAILRCAWAPADLRYRATRLQVDVMMDGLGLRSPFAGHGF